MQSDKQQEYTAQIDVDHIARLAMLSFSPEERQSLLRDMAKLLALADKLPDMDEEPPFDAGPACPLRPDKAEQPLLRGELLKNTPSAENGFVRVPRMME